MGMIVVNEFLTLDGVYQSPGGIDEDLEGGFAFGGWQAPFTDAASGDSIRAVIDRTDALLLGRKTFDIWNGYWPHVAEDHPVGARFNAVPKYVVSTTLTDPAWAGTTVLRDVSTVTDLRERHDEVHVWGSGDLLQSLLADDLVDRLNLWLYPLTLGSGKRLFDSGTAPASLRLVEPARSFDEGAVALVYERAGEVETRNMDDER
jgi:dihydrofolate reductase